MASDVWFSYLESKIFTLVSAELKKKNPNVNYTSKSSSTAITEFPTIVIKELRQDELGMDLDNTTVNAVRESIQVEVYSDKPSSSECESLSRQAYMAMKKLRFNGTGRGVLFRDGDIWERFDTFERVIGQGDTELVTH